MSDELQTTLNDSTVDRISIEPADLTIAGADRARFDQYYKGILYRLHLFENEWTVTPLGEQLAEAFDDAIDVEFDEVRAAVENDEVEMELIHRFASGGCLCQLSNREQELLTRSYFYLVTRTGHYDELQFDLDPQPDLLDLRPFLTSDVREERSLETTIEATLVGTEFVEDADFSEDLGRFFETGRDFYVRCSLVMLLALGEWVTTRPTTQPMFGELADIREIWRLLVHAEHTSHAFQAMFIGLLEAVREEEPIQPEPLLEMLIGHEEFDDTIERGLSGLTVTEGEKERSRLTQIRDTIYFGMAYSGNITVEIDNDVGSFTGTWRDVADRLQANELDGDPFQLTNQSERAYRQVLNQTLRESPSLSKSRRVMAYGALQLARLSTRYVQYFAKDELAPFVEWFRTANTHPGPLTIWRLLDDDVSLQLIPRATQKVGSIDGTAFGTTVAELTERWLVEHYFERLYEKMGESNGKSPQLLSMDVDRSLSFEQQYNNGRPNAPTLKFERLGDIFYELGLTEGADLSGIQLTPRGRKLIRAFDVNLGEDR
ncbi:hypothetical protein NGM07_07750 [Halorussus vallis]|uniref:hypothetical protein n=1 Tax=Halorussus vallis TaxID=2953749 RepID=UPI00209CB315|nr:hypothetical protein [Halorussus vallis]USZ77214.1 hypothetical protein NGM07_07750 [Halorussus vallis]